MKEIEELQDEHQTKINKLYESYNLVDSDLKRVRKDLR